MVMVRTTLGRAIKPQPPVSSASQLRSEVAPSGGG